MGTVQEIEAAVQQLSREDLSQFRDWFEHFDADAWDRQLEGDVLAGKFDRFIADGKNEIRAGKHTEL